MNLPFAYGFYKTSSPIIADMSCINWRPKKEELPSYSQETLRGTEGIESITTVGAIDSCRGAETMGGVPFFVIGTTLYSLSSGGVTTSIGTVSGTGRVSMATNGSQLLILNSSGIGSLWDGTTFTANIDSVDSDFTANGTPVDVICTDGYFLLPTNTGKYIISALNNGLSYTATDVGSAEYDPDGLVGSIQHKGQVFLLGVETTEVVTNQPVGASFPYVRNTGFVINKGLAAKHSLIAGDETFYFVGRGKGEAPAVYRFAGNSVEKVSNSAVDEALQALTSAELSDIYAHHYGFDGQSITSFTLPNECLEFNANTGLWNQRRSLGATGTPLSQSAWRVSGLVTAYGDIYVGDRIDGRIGRLDEDLRTEYGDSIIRQIDTSPFTNQGDSFSVSRLELTFESGAGDSVTPDPQIRMQRSTDGFNFQPSLSRSMGRIGEYTKRAIWRRLGRAARFQVFRFILTDPVNPNLVKLQADFSGEA